MIPVIFNPYADASSQPEEALEHAVRAAENLRHLAKQLSGEQNDVSRLQGQAAGVGCDSLRGCVLLREEGGEHVTLPALLSRLRGQKEKQAAALWLLSFFSRGQTIDADALSAHEATTLEGSELPVPLLGYAAAHGGVASTVAADADWQQEFFRLCNPSAEVLNVSGASRQETLTQWAADWLRENLAFTDYLRVKLGATFCNGALNSLPGREFFPGLREAFEKAQAQSYVCDGILIKKMYADLSPALLELRVCDDGARAFFQVREGRPHIAGFYTKAQAVSQNKAIQQAARRACGK